MKPLKQLFDGNKVKKCLQNCWMQSNNKRYPAKESANQLSKRKKFKCNYNSKEMLVKK